MLLCVNLDHVATLREARKENYPCLLDACLLAENSGADGITLHLREDRRHTQDQDLFEAKKIIKGRFTMEMACTQEMLDIACQVKPDLLTLVPEKRAEITTEGGLNIKKNKNFYRDYIEEIHSKNLKASLFLEPDLEILEIAKEIGADRVELHTGIYAGAKTQDSIQESLKNLKTASEFAGKLGFILNMGHGLNKNNLKNILEIKNLNELHIGHSIVARAVFCGLKEAIQELKLIINNNKIQ